MFYLQDNTDDDLCTNGIRCKPKRGGCKLRTWVHEYTPCSVDNLNVSPNYIIK